MNTWEVVFDFSVTVEGNGLRVPLNDKRDRSKTDVRLPLENRPNVVYTAYMHIESKRRMALKEIPVPREDYCAAHYPRRLMVFFKILHYCTAHSKRRKGCYTLLCVLHCLIRSAGREMLKMYTSRGGRSARARNENPATV